MRRVVGSKPRRIRITHDHSGSVYQPTNTGAVLLSATNPENGRSALKPILGSVRYASAVVCPLNARAVAIRDSAHFQILQPSPAS
jgi:hypothetical protein